MKNVQYFVLHFCSIIQSLAIGQIENSKIINKTHAIDHSLLIFIQTSSTTPEPTRNSEFTNSSTNTQEIATMSGGCHECPNIRGIGYNITYISAKRQLAEMQLAKMQLAEMSFKLFVILIIV